MWGTGGVRRDVQQRTKPRRDHDWSQRAPGKWVSPCAAPRTAMISASMAPCLATQPRTPICTASLTRSSAPPVTTTIPRSGHRSSNWRPSANPSSPARATSRATTSISWCENSSRASTDDPAVPTTSRSGSSESRLAKASAKTLWSSITAMRMRFCCIPKASRLRRRDGAIRGRRGFYVRCTRPRASKQVGRPGLLWGVARHQRGRLQTRVHAQLGQQVLHMRASRSPVHTELIGHPLGTRPFHDEAQHLPLPVGQELQHPQWVVVLGMRAQGLLQHERIHRGVSTMGHLNRLDDGFDGLGLADEALSALGDGGGGRRWPRDGANVTTRDHRARSRPVRTTNPKVRAVGRLTAVLTCDVAWLVLDICSQYLWRVVIALSDLHRYAVCYDEDTGCDARSQNHEAASRQVRSTTQVRQPPAAPHLP